MTISLVSPTTGEQEAATPETTPPISPLIAAGSRFPVGTGNPDAAATLAPVNRRAFLMRGAESVQHSPYAMGATPKTTSGYDGTEDDQSEEFNQPDFSP